MATRPGKTPAIRVTEAVLSTRRVAGRDIPTIRCTFDPQWFQTLERPDYQREELTTDKQEALFAALDPNGGSGVPDAVLLSAREHYSVTWVGAGEAVITAPVLWIFDGLQRVTAGKRRVALGVPSLCLPADIMLGLTEPEEVATFWQLNRGQTPVRTDVLLRTVDNVDACVALRKMAATTPSFPEVQWTHQGASREKLTGHLLYELGIILHGYAQSRTIEGILEALDELTETIGTAKITHNVRAFIKLVDELYADTLIETYTRRVGFLRGLALFLCTYDNFWDKDGNLMVRAPERKRLKSILPNDVSSDLGRSNPGAAVLKGFEDHFSKYRKGVRALKPRD